MLQMAGAGILRLANVSDLLGPPWVNKRVNRNLSDSHLDFPFLWRGLSQEVDLQRGQATGLAVRGCQDAPQRQHLSFEVFISY